MLANLNGWHAVIILAVVLLLFGAPKIPMLARSLGQSMKIFKSEIKPDAKRADDEVTATTATEASASSSNNSPVA
jgi:sec-independent protein translocase protein TatA